MLRSIFSLTVLFLTFSPAGIANSGRTDWVCGDHIYQLEKIVPKSYIFNATIKLALRASPLSPDETASIVGNLESQGPGFKESGCASQDDTWKEFEKIAYKYCDAKFVKETHAAFSENRTGLPLGLERVDFPKPTQTQIWFWQGNATGHALKFTTLNCP